MIIKIVIINKIDFDDNKILFVDDKSYRLKNCLTTKIVLKFEIRLSKILINRRNNEILFC